jgi:hypothetical protein
MPDYKNVQFRGIDTVLKAYENRNCPAWSLWVAKQFLFKYEGSTVEDAKGNLEETLAMIEENGSTAIYTLKIYEDLKQGQKITEKMECHGSFNFRLQDDPNEYRRGSNALESKINALQKRIDEYEAEEEEEDDSALGQINQVLENPCNWQTAWNDWN